jgi:Putative beta-barrel porin-2, OmpL-like. bbp2
VSPFKSFHRYQKQFGSLTPLSNPLYRAISCSTSAQKGEGMNRELKNNLGKSEKIATISKRFWDGHTLRKCFLVLTACASSPFAHAQSASEAQTLLTIESPQEMQAHINKLETEVAELKAIVSRMQPVPATTAAATHVTADAKPAAVIQPHQNQETVQTALRPDDSKVLDFFRDTTINVALDGYYAYNFNSPVGRVNLLRAYDVLSNEFSLNQASLVVEHPPDVAAGRRWGGRLDLQFGQATDTLQGNPANEPRPQIYRNIFQAYGTYIMPVGKGISVDFGKWGSSLGIEGNYSKDQINYSRGYWFDFLPFYHMGVRVSAPITDRFTLNYWVVNGTNQVEATNGFKDELFGFTAKPSKKVVWTLNYYLGQEHPDRTVVAPTSPIPVQPGLSFAAIRPAPNGRTHIFDSYVTWQATPKLSFALEGDYFIQRLWKNEAPGQSSAPSHVAGGAAYVRYQFSPKIAFATRAEYLSDRGGLFSGLTQALKENTVTFDYSLADGFLMRYEWRRDFSNQPSFLTDVQNVLSKDQTTATVGLIWWWGRKEGTW